MTGESPPPQTILLATTRLHKPSTPSSIFLAAAVVAVAVCIEEFFLRCSSHKRKLTRMARSMAPLEEAETPTTPKDRTLKIESSSKSKKKSSSSSSTSSSSTKEGTGNNELESQNDIPPPPPPLDDEDLAAITATPKSSKSKSKKGGTPKSSKKRSSVKKKRETEADLEDGKRRQRNSSRSKLKSSSKLSSPSPSTPSNSSTPSGRKSSRKTSAASSGMESPLQSILDRVDSLIVSDAALAPSLVDEESPPSASPKLRSSKTSSSGRGTPKVKKKKSKSIHDATTGEELASPKIKKKKSKIEETTSEDLGSPPTKTSKKERDSISKSPKPKKKKNKSITEADVGTDPSFEKRKSKSDLDTKNQSSKKRSSKTKKQDSNQDESEAVSSKRSSKVKKSSKTASAPPPPAESTFSPQSPSKKQFSAAQVSSNPFIKKTLKDEDSDSDDDDEAAIMSPNALKFLRKSIGSRASVNKSKNNTDEHVSSVEKKETPIEAPPVAPPLSPPALPDRKKSKAPEAFLVPEKDTEDKEKTVEKAKEDTDDKKLATDETPKLSKLQGLLGGKKTVAPGEESPGRLSFFQSKVKKVIMMNRMFTGKNLDVIAAGEKNADKNSYRRSSMTSQTLAGDATKLRFSLELVHVQEVEDLRPRETSWGDVWDDLYYDEETLAEFKYKAFLEDCNLNENGEEADPWEEEKEESEEKDLPAETEAEAAPPLPTAGKTRLSKLALFQKKVKRVILIKRMFGGKNYDQLQAGELGADKKSFQKSCLANANRRPSENSKVRWSMELTAVREIEDLTKRDTTWGDIWDDLYFDEDTLAEFKYQAFLEECEVADGGMPWDDED